MDERLERLIQTYQADFQHARINCAEAVLTTMCNFYDIDMGVCPMIATPFGGGLCGRQGVCGTVSGALMVIGLKHGRELGGDKDPAYKLGKELMAWFEGEQGALNCRDLICCDFSDPVAQQQFRAPGGAHERVCEPLVGDVCRWLAEHL